jgi:transcription elongation GreA/GreB family factor
MLSRKEELYQVCKEELTSKVADLEKMIDAINDSKNNETKSSAGDKYETGRAMMQMEEDKITTQLEQARQTLSELQQISPDQEHDTVRLGSLVTTDQRTYFMAVSLGKMMVGDQAYFCLSPDSPVGKLLLGKQVGEVIVFNKTQELILDVV